MDLEHLGLCPICGERERRPAYLQTEDGAFGVPGRWDYWTCVCGVLYLDPRPTRHAIAIAYANYYTHERPSLPLLWRATGIRGAARRGYLNARYGYRFDRASRLAGLIWRHRRTAAQTLDFLIRHLPAPPASGSRLLDFGCGNGAFLTVARHLGWEAVGLDPDPRAVEVARSLGLDVRQGTIIDSGLAPGSLQQIVMSHVLEHLHDPMDTLKTALNLLAPGGRLWLSQPNPDAIGLRRFGGHWRGLEPPRHLILIGAARLAELLMTIGFERVELLPPENAARFYFRQSEAIARRLDPFGAAARINPRELERDARAADRQARSSPQLAESLTMIAFRPAD